MGKIDKLEDMYMKYKYEMDMKKLDRILLFMEGITCPILITIIILAKYYA